ncbi:MAG: hypothetical protein DMF61_01415 [Blastocatellia bacterium AA13]|nr:MAG: hypothetical protein DMF61_01415 [Blastocatellia bacterium AA13]
MSTRSSRVLGIVVVLAALMATAFAQGPLRKTVYFSINAPYELRMGHYVLPMGTYTFRQANENDLNLFMMYKGDAKEAMLHSPIAVVRTVRVDHASNRYPSHTQIRWKLDENSVDGVPVVTGWDIPGDDGWQIISVVPSRSVREGTVSMVLK